MVLRAAAGAAAQEHAVLYEGLGWVNTSRAWFRPLWRAVNPVPRARAAINTTRLPGPGPEPSSRRACLDPAGPMFHSMPDIVRLDHSDAEFVDVIHTDSTGLGSKDATGHVDYYPNGGETQPGCSLWTFLELSGLMALFTEPEELFTCSHARATRLFIHSMQPTCRFLACRCRSMRSFRQNRLRLPCKNDLIIVQRSANKFCIFKKEKWIKL
ncbi:Phospholipase A1 VesT1.02, partial [Gryllus bimaculatus]